MNRRDEVRRRIEDASSGINDSTCWDDTEWNDENGKSIMDRLVESIDRIYGVLPDDGEPVTGEFLKAIGCEPERPWPCGTVNWKVPADDFRIWVRVWVIGECVPDAIVQNSGESGNMQVQLQSRGQFRRLCEALGVELKEVKGG